MKDYSLCGVVVGFLVILGLGICEQLYFGKLINEMIVQVDEAERIVYSGDIKESLNILQDIIKNWEKREKLLGVLINHQDIKRISETLREIESKLKYFPKSDNVSANFALLREYILGIEEGNEFTISNIL